jgi:hypothetical protein
VGILEPRVAERAASMPRLEQYNWGLDGPSAYKHGAAGCRQIGHAHERLYPHRPFSWLACCSHSHVAMQQGAINIASMSLNQCVWLNMYDLESLVKTILNAHGPGMPGTSVSSQEVHQASLHADVSIGPG